jgi:hypothetical protein
MVSTRQRFFTNGLLDIGFRSRCGERWASSGISRTAWQTRQLEGKNLKQPISNVVQTWWRLHWAFEGSDPEATVERLKKLQQMLRRFLSEQENQSRALSAVDRDDGPFGI